MENAITNALKIGASCFALFLKSQRQWTAKPMEESTVEKFKGFPFFFLKNKIDNKFKYYLRGLQEAQFLSSSHFTSRLIFNESRESGSRHFREKPGNSFGRGPAL